MRTQEYVNCFYTYVTSIERDMTKYPSPGTITAPVSTRTRAVTDTMRRCPKAPLFSFSNSVNYNTSAISTSIVVARGNEFSLFQNGASFFPDIENFFQGALLNLGPYAGIRITGSRSSSNGWLRVDLDSVLDSEKDLGLSTASIFVEPDQDQYIWIPGGYWDRSYSPIGLYIVDHETRNIGRIIDFDHFRRLARYEIIRGNGIITMLGSGNETNYSLYQDLPSIPDNTLFVIDNNAKTITAPASVWMFNVNLAYIRVSPSTAHVPSHTIYDFDDTWYVATVSENSGNVIFTLSTSDDISNLNTTNFYVELIPVEKVLVDYLGSLTITNEGWYDISLIFIDVPRKLFTFTNTDTLFLRVREESTPNNNFEMSTLTTISNEFSGTATFICTPSRDQSSIPERKRFTSQQTLLLKLRAPSKLVFDIYDAMGQQIQYRVPEATFPRLPNSTLSSQLAFTIQATCRRNPTRVPSELFF